MIYVKVVLKIRYDPRVKRLSKSQKKVLNSLLSSVWKKCRKTQSLQKNMVKKKLEIAGLLSCEPENIEQKKFKITGIF